MDIVFHIGANCTDGEKLIRSLTLNTESLAAQGIAVPNPTRYRRLLRETMEGLGGQPPAPGTRESLLGSILDDPNSTRLVLSNPTFICLPNRVFEGGGFYRVAALKLLALRSLFPQDQIQLHMGIRNPATFVPALWEQAKRTRFAAFMGGIDPTAILWSDVVALIKQTLPDVSLTVWCNEDTPLIWPEIVAAVTGHDPATELEGLLDLAAEIMSPDGVKWMQTYLQNHRPQSVQQRRRIISAFLAKFSLPEKTEVELEMPGWTQELIEDITDTYEQDIAVVQTLPGVTFIGL